MHSIAVWTFLFLLAIPMSNCRRLKAPGDNEAAVVDSGLKGFSNGLQLIDLRRRINANFNNSPSKEKRYCNREDKCKVLTEAIKRLRDFELNSRIISRVCEDYTIKCGCVDEPCTSCALADLGY